MLEFTIGGSKPVVPPNGERRSFLQDDDEISFRGRCKRPGYATFGFWIMQWQDRAGRYRWRREKAV